MTEPLNETNVRLDNHSRRLVALEEVVNKSEKRLTDLEADRETVHNLVTVIGVLTTKVQQMAEGVDAIAERAVAKVLSARSLQRKQGWKHNLGLVTTGASACGGVLGVLAYVFHVFS